MKLPVDWRGALGLVFAGFLWGVGIFLAAMLFSFAHGLIFPKKACAAEPTIPAAALRHRATLVRAAHFEWGLNAPVATLAAQVHVESGWREGLTSPVGARGLTQFMPRTEKWFGGLRPDLGRPDALNPAWAIRAMCAYDRWLYERATANTPCDRMAKALGWYNGGEGWGRKDETLAVRQGLDPGSWDDLVKVNAGRSKAAKHENILYVERNRKLEPLYIRGNWGPGCAVLGGR